MKNKSIRDAIIQAGLRHWQIANELGVSDCHFSRMLRHELSDERKQEVFAAIERLRGGAAGEC